MFFDFLTGFWQFCIKMNNSSFDSKEQITNEKQKNIALSDADQIVLALLKSVSCLCFCYNLSNTKDLMAIIVV